MSSSHLPLDLYDKMGDTDFELCMQIIGRSGKEEIKRKIGAAMISTGVVSGEYGIAEAYENKAQALKQYVDSTNPRIKKFASEMIENLKKSAEEERKRVAEDA